MKGDNGQEERRFGREDRGPMGRRRESWIFEGGNGPLLRQTPVRRQVGSSELKAKLPRERLRRGRGRRGVKGDNIPRVGGWVEDGFNLLAGGTGQVASCYTLVWTRCTRWTDPIENADSPEDVKSDYEHLNVSCAERSARFFARYGASAHSLFSRSFTVSWFNFSARAGKADVFDYYRSLFPSFSFSIDESLSPPRFEARRQSVLLGTRYFRKRSAKPEIKGSRSARRSATLLIYFSRLDGRSCACSLLRTHVDTICNTRHCLKKNLYLFYITRVFKDFYNIFS